jgi:hypothetical protein
MVLGSGSKIRSRICTSGTEIWGARWLRREIELWTCTSNHFIAAISSHLSRFPAPLPSKLASAARSRPALGAAGRRPAATSRAFRGPCRPPATSTTDGRPPAASSSRHPPTPRRCSSSARSSASDRCARMACWLLVLRKLALPCSLRALCSTVPRADALHSRPCCLAQRDAVCL